MTVVEGRARGRLALVISEVFSPVYQVFVLLVVVGVASAGWQRGLVLALVAATFAGVIPYLILLRGVRTGRFTDLHLSDRSQRPFMMAIGLGCVVIAVVLMAVMRAPPELFALVGSMAAGVAVALAISSVWKISIHTSVTAGSVAVLAVLFGPVMLGLAPVVVAVGWSRLVLEHHTPAQVVVGALVGAVVATVTMSVLLSVA